MKRDLIDMSPGIVSGAPKLVGTRINIFNVVSVVFYEEKYEHYYEDRNLTKEHIIQALNYCKALQCQKDSPEHYCDGCVLRTLGDGERRIDLSNYEEHKDEDGNSFTVSQDRSEIFLGSKEELEHADFGQPGWIIAEKILNKYPELRRE